MFGMVVMDAFERTCNSVHACVHARKSGICALVLIGAKEIKRR